MLDKHVLLATEPEKVMAQNVERSAPSNWLPIVDTFRTLCLAPTDETREIFDRFEELLLAV